MFISLLACKFNFHDFEPKGIKLIDEAALVVGHIYEHSLGQPPLKEVVSLSFSLKFLSTIKSYYCVLIMSPSNSLSGDESGISLGSQDSVIQDLPDSEIDSDYVPSEMGEDRAFLASDTEQLSYLSDGSSSPHDPILSILYDYTIQEDNKVRSSSCAPMQRFLLSPEGL
jgi:hypothetical protein